MSQTFHFKSTLLANGYPCKFLDSVINQFLSKQYSCALPTYGPEKKPVFLCLPYIGEEATRKVTRQIRRLLAKVAPWMDIKLVFRSTRKLSCLTKIKSRFTTESNSGVVYKVSCGDCGAFYIGKTKRRLQQRLQEHQQQDYSALRKHSIDQDHDINFGAAQILATDNNDFRLTIKEAILIKDQSCNLSLNANIRSCELLLW